MRSLWMRLTGAFILVILLYGTVDNFLVHRSTQEQFKRYTSQTGLAWAERLAPSLEQYYETNGSWEGADSIFQSSSMGMPSMMMGNMMMGDMQSEMMETSNVWDMMGFQLVLVDLNGWVQTDTSGNLAEAQLTASDLTTGISLMLDNAQIGTLLALDTSLSPDSASNAFVHTLSTTNWQASLVAAFFALIIGSLLFRQIISPIRSVTDAARKIATGDLDQRVPEGSSDEIGQMAQTFNQMADALEHDRLLRQNMTADIAHELRTPLSIIQGNLEAMMDGVLPSNPKEIASLHEETLLLNRLVADLRLLSLAEAGQLHLDRTDTDILALVKQIVVSLQPTADALHVALVTDLPVSCPNLRLDIDRTNQIFHNIIANALRFTPADGKITVHARLTEEAILVDISDTGTGIAPDDLPYIFDRFYRGEKSRNRASGGSGIGLAIVRQLMQAQGGDVEVKSPVQVENDDTQYGSCFTLSFPLS